MLAVNGARSNDGCLRVNVSHYLFCLKFGSQVHRLWVSRHSARRKVNKSLDSFVFGYCLSDLLSYENICVLNLLEESLFRTRTCQIDYDVGVFNSVFVIARVLEIEAFHQVRLAGAGAHFKAFHFVVVNKLVIVGENQIRTQIS